MVLPPGEISSWLYMKTKKVPLPESKSHRPGQSHQSRNNESNSGSPSEPLPVGQPAPGPTEDYKLPAKYAAILRAGYPLTKSKRALLANLLHAITSTPETSPEFLRCLTELAKTGIYLALAGNMDLFAQKVLGWPTGKIEPILQKSGVEATAGTVVLQTLPTKVRARTIKGEVKSAPVDVYEVDEHARTPASRPLANHSGVSYWAERINQRVAQSVDSMIGTGQELIAAKNKLDHGQWQAMFESGLVRIHLRSAEKLMRIARNHALAKTTNSSLLPTSPDALYLLSAVDADKVEAGIKDGHICPQMTIAQAKWFTALQQGDVPRVTHEDYDYYYEKLDKFLKKTFTKVPEDFFGKMAEEVRAIVQRIVDDHRRTRIESARIANASHPR